MARPSVGRRCLCTPLSPASVTGHLPTENFDPALAGVLVDRKKNPTHQGRCCQGVFRRQHSRNSRFS